MSQKYTLGLIKDSCHLAMVCPSRSEFISRVESASAKEGATAEEARVLAITLANGLGVVDTGLGNEGEVKPYRRGRNPFVFTAEGLLWGLAVLAAAVTVLNLGTSIIERVSGAGVIVSECQAVGCVPH